MRDLATIVKKSITATAQHRNGHRDGTVARAFVGALMLMGKHVPIDTVVEAAAVVGVSPSTLAAARKVLATEDPVLIRDVLDGKPLIPTAKDIEVRVQLIDAFRKASPTDLQAFAATIGVGNLWDQVISPQV